MSESERRLAAIMYTDIVGFTALTQADEARAMEVLDRHDRLLKPFFPRFHGREVKSMGDSFLVEFESALDALKCATEIQAYLHDYNVASKEEWKIKLRIGIHLGDVIHKGGDVFGDAVNITSRIYPLAEPEGVCVSDQVFGQVRNKVSYSLEKMAPQRLKNVQFPVDVYRVVMPWERGLPAEEEAGSVLPRDRIAVLPFRNMSPDPNDDYFAEGMTEEIISTVSGIGQLSVISRTSIMRYKGTDKSVEEIGKELKVGTVLEGSLRKAGNRIRVTAQLVDVAEDKHLWARNYDRTLDDIFEVQSDVAKQVAEALRVRILSPERERIDRKPTESTIAYILYLKGRNLWNKRGLEDIKRAEECFDLAVHEDPEFAFGYAGLADCAILLRNNIGISPEENLAKSKMMCERALHLDPALAEAHATLGLVYESEYELGKAEREFKRAIELKPSYATAHQWYSEVLRSELRWEEALEEAEEAAQLDPLSAMAMNNLGEHYWSKRDFARAARHYKQALELGFDAGHVSLFWTYGMMKMYDKMESEAGSFVRYYQDLVPRPELALEVARACIVGDRETAGRLVSELDSHPEEAGLDSMGVAQLHFLLGDVDGAFEWLLRAHSKGEYSLLGIQWDWHLDGVRADPRYLDLLRRLGLDRSTAAAERTATSRRSVDDQMAASGPGP